MPNNRQWAILFWIGIFAIFVLSRREVRSSVGSVVRTASQPIILIPLAFMAAWVSLEVWIGVRVSLWNSTLLTDTTFWFFSSGLVLFFNFEEASQHSDFFRRKATFALAPAAVMVALLDAFVLPLLAEIVLQFALVFVAMLAAVASRMEARHRPVASMANAIVGLVVLGYVAAAIAHGLTSWGDIDKANLLREVIMPGWLTIGLLPLIYFVALYAAYQLALVRLDLPADGTQTHWSAKLALFTSFHVKATEVSSFAGFWPRRLAAATSFTEARTVIQEFRTRKDEERRAQAEARARLVRYAGIDGVDEDGRRLDRREFEETTDALRWLSTCMMGWYRNLNSYRADMLNVLGDDFTRQGLPKPSGITVRVRGDGQSWYACRRTITGWCFGIGAAGPPPDLWEYDGVEPPEGYPGEDPAWGSGPFGDEVNRNW